MCNRSSSLLGGVRATDKETRTNLPVVWSCTLTEHITSIRLTTISLSWERWREAPSTALRFTTLLRGPVELDLGFYICKSSNDTSCCSVTK